MNLATLVQSNQSLTQPKNYEKNISVKNSPAFSDYEGTNKESSLDITNTQQRKTAAFYFADTIKTDVVVVDVSHEFQLIENNQKNVSNETQLLDLYHGEDLHIDVNEDLGKENDDTVTTNLADDEETKIYHIDSDVIYLPDKSTKILDHSLPNIPIESDLLIIMDEDSFQNFLEQENVDTTAQVKSEKVVSKKQINQIESILPDAEFVKEYSNSNPNYLQHINVDTSKDHVHNMLQTVSPSKFSEVKIIMDDESSVSSQNDPDETILMEYVEEKPVINADQIAGTHVKEGFVSAVPNDVNEPRNLEFEKLPDLREILIQSRIDKNKFQKLSDLQLLRESQEKTLIKKENCQILEPSHSLIEIKKEIVDQNTQATEQFTNELAIEKLEDVKPLNVQKYVTKLEFEEEKHNLSSLLDVTKPKLLENSEVKQKRKRRRGRRKRKNKQLDSNSNIQYEHIDSAKSKELIKTDKMKEITMLPKEIAFNKHISEPYHLKVLSDEHNIKEKEKRRENSVSIDKQKFTRNLQYDKQEEFGATKRSMKAVENISNNTNSNNDEKTKDKVLNTGEISRGAKSIKNMDNKIVEKHGNKDEKRDNLIEVKNIDLCNKVKDLRKETPEEKEKANKESLRIPKRKDPLPPENPIKRVKLRPETTNTAPRDHTQENKEQALPVAKVAPRSRSPVRAPVDLVASHKSWEQMWTHMKMLQARLIQAEEWKSQCDEELAKWDRELERCNQQLAKIRARRNLASEACDKQEPAPSSERRRRRRARAKQRKRNETTLCRHVTDPRLSGVAVEERDKIDSSKLCDTETRDKRYTNSQERKGQIEEQNKELEDKRQSNFIDLKITTNGRQRLINPYSEEKNLNTLNKNSSKSILQIRSLPDIDPWTL